MSYRIKFKGILEFLTNYKESIKRAYGWSEVINQEIMPLRHVIKVARSADTYLNIL